MLYWYCKEKFCLGHSWELRGLLRVSNKLTRCRHSSAHNTVQPPSIYYKFNCFIFFSGNWRSLILIPARHTGNLYNDLLIYRRVYGTLHNSSVNCLGSSCCGASDCLARGWGFEPPTGPTLRSWDNWRECAAFSTQLVRHSSLLGQGR